MADKKAAKKKAAKSVASNAVVTLGEDGSKLVHLPDGVFEKGKGRANGDAAGPDESPVLVEFSADAKVNGVPYRAGSRVEIPRHLAESLHKVCAEVVDG